MSSTAAPAANSRRAFTVTAVVLLIGVTLASAVPVLPLMLVLAAAAVVLAVTSPWYGLLAIVLATFLLPVPFSYHLGGTTLTVARMVTIVVAAGWYMQHRRPDGPTQREATPFDTALVALLVVAALSTVVNLSSLTGYEAAGAVRSIVTILVDYLLPFALTVAVLWKRPARTDGLVRLLVGLGGLCGLLAVIEFVTHENVFQFLHPILPARTNATIAAEAQSAVLSRGAFFRVHSTFEQPLILGAVLAMVLPLGLALAARARRPLERWGWSLAVLLMIAGILFTASRAAYLLLLGSIVLMAVLAGRGDSRRLFVWLSLILIAIGALVPAVRHQVAASFQNRSGTQLHNSLQHRLDDLGPTLTAAATHPLLGFGPRTFAQDELDRSHRLAPPANDVLDDTYLGTLAEEGIAGIAALALVLVTAVVAAARSVRRAPDPGSRLVRAGLLTAVVNWILIGFVADTYTFNAPPRIFFVLLAVIAVTRLEDGWPQDRPPWLRAVRTAPPAPVP